MNDNAICIGGDVIESQKKREPWKDKAIEPKGPAAISKIGSSIEIETIKDDDEYVEHIARENFGLIMDGEEYIIEDPE